MFLCTSKTFQRVTRLPFLPCNNLGIDIGIAYAFPRSKTLVPVKTDYEAANIKLGNAISNRNCYSVQDVIKNYETIMSYNNVINPVYLIHGTYEIQLEYLRSILDRIPYEAQAEKIIAAILPELRKDSNVDPKKIRRLINGFKNTFNFIKKFSFYEIVLKEVISIIPSIFKELYLVSMDIQNPLQIPI
ncbi:hypothetical protein ACTFIR_012850 [Dictyostelium discoideum]